MDITSPLIIERYKNLRYRESADAAEEGTPSGHVTPDAGAFDDGAAMSPSSPCRVLEARGDNPLCGDDLRVRLKIEDAPTGAIIRRARYAGYGCSLCLACADVLMEHVEGMPAREAAKLTVEDVKRLWGGLEVSRSREDCVALSANVLRHALEGIS